MTPLIELLLLVILSIDVALKVMWHTPKNYLRKRLTILKVCMYVISCHIDYIQSCDAYKYTHIINLLFYCKYYLKYCRQSVWNILHEVRVEWQIQHKAKPSAMYICHKTLTKCCIHISCHNDLTCIILMYTICYQLTVRM